MQAYMNYLWVNFLKRSTVCKEWSMCSHNCRTDRGFKISGACLSTATIQSWQLPGMRRWGQRALIRPHGPVARRFAIFTFYSAYIVHIILWLNAGKRGHGQPRRGRHSAHALPTHRTLPLRIIVLQSKNHLLNRSTDAFVPYPPRHAQTSASLLLYMIDCCGLEAH